jgi:hypothetical protein
MIRPAVINNKYLKAGVTTISLFIPGVGSLK